MDKGFDGITMRIDRKALIGVAEVLEIAITADPPYTMITDDGVTEKEEQVSREELLEHYLEYAIEAIYDLTDLD